MTGDRTYGGKRIATALKAEGVEALFGVHGGMSLPVTEACKLGISMYHVRHEQAAGFAADAYARCTRKPAVTFTSLAAGLANHVPGIFHACGAPSPVVHLASCNAPLVEGMSTAQEGNGAELLKGLCKWTHRVNDPRTISFWVRKALRDSAIYRPGPVTLEFPMNVVMAKDTGDQVKYLDAALLPPTPRSAGDPACVQKAVETLVQAKRPVIVAGDGVYWSDACVELVELAELLEIPVCTRRMARGGMREDHELAWTPEYRRGFLEDADVVCLVGHRVTDMDSWFEPPDWPCGAKFVQIQEISEEIWYARPTIAAVVGCSKLVLRQMIDCARGLDQKVSGERAAWLEALRMAKARLAARRRETVQSRAGSKPIHPRVLAAEIADFLDPTATMILDSFTLSGHVSGQVEAKYAGQILDAGMFLTLGHSIGMAIGAQVARPGRQVVALVGDGGFGIGGMDVETLLRYKLPAVIVLFNNSSWGGRAWGKELYYTGCPSNEMLPQIRYDLMFGALGCHSEFVTEDAQIKPALERAFNSGRTALLNVIADDHQLHPVRMRDNLLEVWLMENRKDLPEEALIEMRSWTPAMIDSSYRRGRDRLAIDVPLDELARIAADPTT